MRWVKIEEDGALPPINQIVLLCFIDYRGAPYYQWGARIDDIEGWMWGVSHDGSIAPLLRATEGSNDVEVDDDYQPTHWMPLLEPPA